MLLASPKKINYLCRTTNYRNMVQHVIMLQIKRKKEFYGSPWSLYSKHTKEELGISKDALNNYFHLNKPNKHGVQIYKNKMCTIIRGEVYVEPSTRGAKKKTPE